jgi:hypothetical protein
MTEIMAKGDKETPKRGRLLPELVALVLEWVELPKSRVFRF